jgi:hypothetical protein
MQIAKPSTHIHVICPQVIHSLIGLVESIDVNSPMLVVPFAKFQSFGKLPRSSDRIAVRLSEAPSDAAVVFISHRWLRPSTDIKAAHPDDFAGSKHALICDGVHKLAAKKGWSAEQVYVWLDFAGIEQDNPGLLQAGVASLRGYITMCDAVLIPSPKVPAEDERTIDKIGGEYGERAWTRLESMSFYTVSMVLFFKSFFMAGLLSSFSCMFE